jgi:thiamine kinase-like enzyme
MQIDNGNTNITFITDYGGVKCIGQKLAFVNFTIPTMEFCNKLSDHLAKQGIITPKVYKQIKEYRIMEFLEGEFKNSFNEEEQVKAVKFLKKLHDVLKDFSSPNPSYNLIKMMELPKEQTIWGDTKADNFLWRNGEIVGIVDYDTVCKSDVRFDVAQGVISWQNKFDYDRIMELVQLYGGLDNMEKVLRYFLLVHHKKFTNHVLFGSYSKSRTQEYWLNRIHQINMAYDEIAERTL